MNTRNIETRLEQKLASTLRPVAARTEFVHGLGGRIQHLRSTVQRAGASTWKFILVMVAGLLSLGVLVTWVGRWLHHLLRGGRGEEKKE